MQSLAKYYDVEKYPHLANIEIDSVAKQTLESAEQAVQATLNKRRKMDEAGLEGETLYIYRGTDHDKVLQLLADAAYVGLLNNAGEDFSLTTEMPNDFLKFEFHRRANILNQLPLKWLKKNDNLQQLLENDNDGLLTIAAMLTTKVTTYSRETELARLMYYLSRGVRPHFNDVSRQKNNIRYLRTANENTELAVKAANANSLFPSAVRYRNFHMLDYNTKLNSRIIVQLCGNEHTLGIKGQDSLEIKEHEFAHSLVGLSEEQGLQYLAMPSYSSFYNVDSMPDDYAIQSCVIWQDRLPEITAPRGFPNVSAFLGGYSEGTDLKYPVVENTFIASVFDSSSWHDANVAFTDEDVQRCIDVMQPKVDELDTLTDGKESFLPQILTIQCS